MKVATGQYGSFIFYHHEEEFDAYLSANYAFLISLSTDTRAYLQSPRYQGRIIRLLDSINIRYENHSYCLLLILSEKQMKYLKTICMGASWSRVIREYINDGNM